MECLSKHFKLEEFINSPTANKLKIDNTPTDEIINNLLEVAELLEIIRNKYNHPIIITSGYRCKKLNDAVKGSKTSQHVKGQAADIISVNNKDLFMLIEQMIIKGQIKVGQLIDEKNYRWIHISTPHLNNNNQILHIK